MAVEQVIKISLDDLKALGGIDNLKKSLGETEQSTKSLKQQLREATAEVAQMAEKYGEASKETVQAAKRAAELKDKIEDANDAIMAFKGEGAFLATGKALQGVASGFAAAQGAMGLFGVESENLEKQLLKVQSAMALAQGLEGLEDLGRAFTQLKAVAINAFNGIKAAIGSTGIGAIVIALGAIYYYWDDIKEVVSGVSEEQRKLTELSENQYEVEKKKSSELGNQDNILKLQGKSDKEILAIKIKQQKAEINKGLLAIKNLETERKLAIENAKYYKNIYTKLANVGVEVSLMGIRVLTRPIDLMIKTANAVSEKLGFGKITDFNVEDAINKVKKWGVESVGNLLFDVNQTELTDKINKYKSDILKTQNDLAGNIINHNTSDKKTTSSTTSTKSAEKSTTEKKDPLDAINPATGNTYKSELESMKAAQAAQTQAKLDQLNLEDQINSQAYEREKEWSDKKIELARLEAQAKEEMLYLYSDALSLIADAVGENTAVGKAAAVASTIISTYSAAQKAYESQLSIPTIDAPIRASIAAGIAVAGGLLNVKKILAVKTDKTKGSQTASTGGVGGAGGNVPSPQFNVAGNAGVNQIASTLANKEPIKAYVVAKEVSTQQSLDRNIVKNATL